MLNSKGYTAVELLTTLTIVGMLGVVSVPKAVDMDKIRQVVCQYQQRQLQHVVELYRIQHNEYPRQLQQLVPDFYRVMPECTVAKKGYLLEPSGRIFCSYHDEND